MSWFSKKRSIDFLSIGDVFIDTFIELEDANVHCDINNENCTISMRFADKIPYKNVTRIAGVGNAGNAAVASARLGLNTTLLSVVGTDKDGDDILESYKKEQIDPCFISRDKKLPTNNAYVLQYDVDRTILVKQEPYAYEIPRALEDSKPSWIYLTSLGKHAESFHHELAVWLEKNPDVKLAFQPGTFQMKLGKEALSDIYKRTDAFFCNKEEAQRILNLPEADFKELHTEMRKLGPTLIVITDGVKGLTASKEDGIVWKLPMFPDKKPPVERTGAGDSCSSTIIAAMILGKSFEEALLWGPINSANVVQYVGAQAGLLSRDALEQELASKKDEYRIYQIPD
jgi:ribokinase